MGHCATDVDIDLLVQAKKLWPRIRAQFRDEQLRDVQEDLESAALERVLKYQDKLSRLQGAERDAALQRTLILGALDEARKTTPSSSTHRRALPETHRAPGPHADAWGAEDPHLAAVETLEALKLSREERVIAGCYALGCRNPRDIAAVTGDTVDAINERLRTLIPYMRGMLSGHVAPGLDENTRELICRYAQGDLHTPRRWRERHNAQRLVANSPECSRLWQAQCATDERLRMLLPAPVLAALTAHHAGDATESAAYAAGGLRQHIADATATARRHAAGLYHKAIDPTPLAGIRPGAAGAMLASCLTIGGGAATYCVNAAVNPIEAIRNTVTPAQHHKVKRAARRGRPRAAQALATATPPATLPAATATTPAKQAASPAPVAASQPPSSPPPSTPGDEFGPESASTSSPSSSQGSSARSRPAPAPANGPGEFAP